MMNILLPSFQAVLIKDEKPYPLWSILHKNVLYIFEETEDDMFYVIFSHSLHFGIIWTKKARLTKVTRLSYEYITPLLSGFSYQRWKASEFSVHSTPSHISIRKISFEPKMKSPRTKELIIWSVTSSLQEYARKSHMLVW